MKKQILFSIFCCLFCLQGAAQSSDSSYIFSYFKGNGEDGLHLAYSEDGFIWKALKDDKSFLKPVLSPDKLMRDPCIIRAGDGKFHMVWTVSWTQKGIGYASSEDLIHWSEQTYIPVMEKQAGARNTWAPELTYDPKSDSYMIYWATTIQGAFPETQIQADNAYNHRMYYVTTKDFKEFSPTKLLYDPGFNCIDATIVPHHGGWMMVIKDETKEPAQKNLKLAFSEQLTGPYSKASAAITGDYWAEGPTLDFAGGRYRIYFDKYMDGHYGVIESSDLKTWTDLSDKLEMPKGIRHGSIFRISKQEIRRLQDL